MMTVINISWSSQLNLRSSALLPTLDFAAHRSNFDTLPKSSNHPKKKIVEKLPQKKPVAAATHFSN
jgi:hypothetical protein